MVESAEATDALHAWTADEPLRLVQVEADKADPDPKALACYGLLRDDTGEMLLRFVAGRPVSQVTEDFLAWVCGRLHAEGKKALLLVWDNASWHVSQRVRAWIKTHNRQAKREGGVRILACYLPVKSPWLNADRVQVGAWQESDHGAGAEVDGSGSQGPGSQLLWLRASGTSQTEGRLILH